ncbi:transcription factor bHLH149 [Abrus precatorius]|uniref:Transcription factor bHLH149 n=1 Tax=Abrus precatorius TaxID=3816 RepID=A0A8B8MED5_ABRPR|nr:transcription factor bHLH149 [Abrus precatorius]
MASFQPNIDSSNSDTLRESNHKKRKKIGDPAGERNSLNLIPWSSEVEQRIYSRRLVEALRRTTSSATKPRAAGQVRETADRVLAATAKGRTRWSRAILRRWKKLQRQHKKVKKVSAGLKRTGIGGERRSRLPAVQKKARVLSRLVPGCRKVSFPNLLEEASDYISALEMQVRAMTALAEILSGSAPDSPVAC